MYLPPAFAPPGDPSLFELMEAHPFATLVAFGAAGTPVVNHLPVIVDRGTAGAVRLLGHMARKNPQWQLWATNPAVLVMFHGPHTYVTPRWYSVPDVPTWNYAVVHVYGRARTLERPRDLVGILAKMTDRFEGTGQDAWRFEVPEDLKGPGELEGAIVGFEVEIERLEGKLKLSQNRAEADQAGVIAGLSGRSDDDSRGVLELMRRQRGVNP